MLVLCCVDCTGVASHCVLPTHPPTPPVPPCQVLGRQCGTSGWPGEQVIVAAAARRYVKAMVKLAALGQFSKRDSECLLTAWQLELLFQLVLSCRVHGLVHGVLVLPSICFCALHTCVHHC